MIYTLGILGVLQMLFIPGLILYRFLSKTQPHNFWLALPIIFTLSFVFNYFLVFALTSIHLYLPEVLRCFTGIEIILLCCCYPRFWQAPMISNTCNWVIYPSGQTLTKKYTRAYFFIFLGITTLWILLWLIHLGDVFGIRDPSVSYNIWAISWSRNELPILTWHYPQLMPSNWSIPYVMMGSLPGNIVLEMFPQTANLLFPILFMLVFFDLYRQEYNRAYLLASIFTTLFMFGAFRFIRTGHMDWVCAFFNLLSLALFYRLYSHTKFSWRLYLQLILTISASALSKPAGIATAILIPLLMFRLLKIKNARDRRLLMLGSYVLLAILIMPWYIYAEYHEVIASSDVWFLIWGDFRMNSWFHYAAEILFFGWLGLALIFAIFVFAQSLPRFWRSVFYFYSPYFLIWAFFYSYDNRNLDLLLPVLTLCISLIMVHHDFDMTCVAYLKKLFFKINKLGWLLFVLLITAALVFFQEPWFRGHLIAHELAAKNQIYDGQPALPELRSYAQCPGYQGKILTPMLIFGVIPALSPYIIHLPPQTFGSDMLPDVFSTPAILQATLKYYPNTRYFLFNNYFQNLVTSADTRLLLNHWLQNGSLRIVINKNDIVLYQIMVPLEQLDFTVPSAPAAK
jgi:hypothetical protein